MFVVFSSWLSRISPAFPPSFSRLRSRVDFGHWARCTEKKTTLFLKFWRAIFLFFFLPPLEGDYSPIQTDVAATNFHLHLFPFSLTTLSSSEVGGASHVELMAFKLQRRLWESTLTYSVSSSFFSLLSWSSARTYRDQVCLNHLTAGGHFTPAQVVTNPAADGRFALWSYKYGSGQPDMVLRHVGHRSLDDSPAKYNIKYLAWVFSKYNVHRANERSQNWSKGVQFGEKSEQKNRSRRVSNVLSDEHSCGL